MVYWGKSGAESLAALERVMCFCDLAEVLTCPIAFAYTERLKFACRRVDFAADPVSVIGGTRARLRRGRLGGDPAGALRRNPRTPLTSEEVRECPQSRRELGAKVVFDPPACAGSGPSRLFLE